MSSLLLISVQYHASNHQPQFHVRFHQFRLDNLSSSLQEIVGFLTQDHLNIESFLFSIFLQLSLFSRILVFLDMLQFKNCWGSTLTTIQSIKYPICNKISGKSVALIFQSNPVNLLNKDTKLFLGWRKLLELSEVIIYYSV